MEESPVSYYPSFLYLSLTSFSLCYPGRAIHHVKEQVFVEEQGMRRGVPRVLVVLTDGRSQDDVTKVAKDLQREGQGNSAPLPSSFSPLLLPFPLLFFLPLLPVLSSTSPSSSLFSCLLLSLFLLFTHHLHLSSYPSPPPTPRLSLLPLFLLSSPSSYAFLISRPSPFSFRLYSLCHWFCGR